MSDSIIIIIHKNLKTNKRSEKQKMAYTFYNFLINSDQHGQLLSNLLKKI